MTTTLELSEVGPQLSALLQSAQQGDEITLTHEGQPIARVTPLPPSRNGAHPNGATPRPRVPGLHRGMVWMSDDFDAEMPEFWETLPLLSADAAFAPYAVGRLT